MSDDRHLADRPITCCAKFGLWSPGSQPSQRSRAPILYLSPPKITSRRNGRETTSNARVGQQVPSSPRQSMTSRHNLMILLQRLDFRAFQQAAKAFICTIHTATRLNLWKKAYSSSLKYRHDCGAEKLGNLPFSIVKHRGCLYFHASPMLNTNAFAHPS